MHLCWTRKFVWAALALLLVGLLAPVLVTVNFMHGKIAAALSRELGRDVQTRAIHLKLFGGPGFEIDNVTVGENPRFGVEPFARIETLQATLGLSSLWKDRIEFHRLILVRPSVNLVQDAEGRWNVQSLGKAAASGSLTQPSNTVRATRDLEQLPKISIEGGRINFKSENRKRVFLIDNLDMEISPPASASEPWRLSFEGRPNRTDIPVDPAGRFRGQAAIGPSSPEIHAETGTLAHLDLTAENVMVSDLLKIVTGNDHGVHGTLNWNLHLGGTTSLLRVSGTVDLRELHRWDRLPPASASAIHLDIAALLDLERELLELRSLTIPVSEGFVAIQGEIPQLLHRPRPSLEAEFRDVPLHDVVEVAKQFTTNLDPGFSAQGNIAGKIRMDGSPNYMSGAVAVTRGRIERKGAAQVVRVSDFDLIFNGKTGKAGPATLNLGEGDKLSASLDWDFGKRAMKARLEGDGVRLVSFLPWARSVSSRWGQANLSSGRMDLRMNAAFFPGAGEPPSIAGWVQLTNAVFNPASVSQPVEIQSARLEFQPEKITVKPLSAHLGTLQVSGSLIAKLAPPAPNQPASARPAPAIEFDLRANQVDLGELDRVLNPRYRQRPFFGFDQSPAPAPNFFAGLAARGTLQAASFRIRKTIIGNLKASIDYHHRTLEVKNFSGDFAGGTQSGKALIQFGPGTPDFSLESRFSNLDVSQLTKDLPSWNGFFAGKLGGTIRLAGSGWDLQEIAEHLGGSGEATGANLEVSGINLASGESKAENATRISSLTSRFQIAKKEVVITNLTFVPVPRPGRSEPRVSFAIKGTVGFDRALDLMVAEKSGAPKFHWGGTLAEPLVSETAASLR